MQVEVVLTMMFYNTPLLRSPTWGFNYVYVIKVLQS